MLAPVEKWIRSALPASLAQERRASWCDGGLPLGFDLADGFDLVHDCEDGVDGSGGDDAVAEVEDVAGAVGGGGEDFGDAGCEDVRRGEEGDGVEVALDGYGVVELAPGAVERGAPVEAEDIAAGVAHERSRVEVSTPK